MEISVPVFENIWLVDDDIDDCMFFENVQKEVLPRATLTILSNVSSLMRLFATGQKPDMLFLDMHMPCAKGFGCLADIRAQPELSTLPIVAFSGSLHIKQIHLAYHSGANLFYAKPDTLPGLVKGLTALFKLNWNDPAAITRAHCINNEFVAFTYPE